MPRYIRGVEPISLGPFDLDQPIGKGGMGVIWSARHRGQDIPAAVKVLTLSRAKDFGFRAAFRKEVRAVAGLDHPNIVVVFDHGEVSVEAETRSEARMLAGTPYLAMELVPGGSLATQKGQIEWPQLRVILLDLLSALAHAHSRGVIHRDIKPGNVLIREDGTVKLTDFGLAHATAGSGDEETDARKRGGTPAYMAPEQLQGNWRDYGPWTDLYALGCLGWSMCTGRSPFSGGTWVEVMHGHLTRKPPTLQPRVSVPPEFEDWLRKLLRKAPENRFRRAADAAWALLQTPEVAPDGPTTIESPAAPIERAVKTTLFWSAEEVPTPATTPIVREEPDASIWYDPPPIPRDWRRLELGRSHLLLGAGLGLYGLRSIALVGRDREQDALWAALRKVDQQQTPALTLIRGPVGCGKSRLAAWLCERAHEVGGATILRATHSPRPGPGDGLGRMVANHVNAVGLAPDALLERLKMTLELQGVTDAYEWRGLAELIQPGQQHQPVRLSSPRERYQLLEGLVVRLCQERPVVIWLDDVQWGADAVGFAKHLMSRKLKAPLFLLLTSRNDQSGKRSAGIRGLLEQPATQDIPLGQLEPVHASALVRDLLGLRGELADQVEQRAAGNPLFAVQLVGDWVNRGLLEPTERGFRLRDGVQVHLPDDLHEVWSGAIRPILAASPVGALVTLELASSLGQTVDANEWNDVCAVAGAAAPEHVADQLVEAGLLRTTEVGWQFVHAMMRESLERTSREKGRWARHNLACATMLQDRYPSHPEAIAGRLGRHLLMAGHTERAVGLLLTGVRRLADASEYREALELLDRRDRALESLGAGASGPRRVEGWLLRARVYLRQGRPHLARAWAEQALQATQHLDAPLLRGWALSRVADAYRHRGESRRAERQYLAALSVFRDQKHWAGVGDCLQGLGQLADQRGRYNRARELLEEARSAYAAINAPLMLAQCIQGLATAHRKMGNVALSRTLAEEALARFDGLGSTSGLAGAERALAVLDLIGKNWESSREHWTNALALYERTGDPLGQHNCLNGLAELARGLEDYETAETGYRRALEIAEAIDTGERMVPELNLALTILRQGRIDEAQAHLENISETLETAGRKGLLGGAHISLMATAALKNDVARFSLHFKLGKDLIAQTGMVDPDVAWPAEMAAEALIENDQIGWARSALELALVQWSALGLEEDVTRVQARLSELGRPE